MKQFLFLKRSSYNRKLKKVFNYGGVAALMKIGKTEAEICKILDLSPSTVSSISSKILIGDFEQFVID